jgi:hypothetical protein
MASRKAIKVSAARYGSVKKSEGAALTTGTFEIGAVLVRSTGLLTEAGANPVNIVGVAIHGQEVAAKHAQIQYVPVSPEMEFEMTLTNATDVAADVETTLAVTHLDNAYGITEDADGRWYVDTDKTAGDIVRVSVLKLADPAGTGNGQVKVAFLANTDLGEAAPVRCTVYGGLAT